MGELILCNQNMAAFPYYVEEAAIGVYSLEELSYYICHNVYLLRSDFMNEDLCNWLERELKLKDAADALREIVRKGGTLSEFVTCLLSQSGYCDRMQIAQIAQQIAELEHKSEYECSKIRADRYVTNGRYAAAVSAYRALLADQEAENPILVGNVWHNMGKAYTGLFRFREAADCYRKAYGLNENPESLRECLYAYRCLHDDDGFKNTAAECGMTAEEAAEAAHRLSELSRTEEIRQFEEQVDGRKMKLQEFLQSGKIPIGKIAEYRGSVKRCFFGRERKRNLILRVRWEN